MTTNASHYYERAARAADRVEYRRDVVDGEVIAMLIGALVFGFALALTVVGLVIV